VGRGLGGERAARESGAFITGRRGISLSPGEDRAKGSLLKARVEYKEETQRDAAKRVGSPAFGEIRKMGF